MTNPLTRRRFLTISAGFGLAASSAQATEIIRWRGRALGAGTTMILTGLSQREAQPVIRATERELTRLEGIFSLYHQGSEIARLNASGWLGAPSPDLLQVLSLSASLHKASLGAFDPSVQPVWQALATGGDPARARKAVGWQFVRFDSQGIRLTRPGMGLTLNGIAQGYVTDRIAALLRARGLGNILIDMGEIAAIGSKPDGEHWQAGISRPDGQIVRHVALRDRALATSAPYGTVLPARPSQGHIIDPTTASADPKHTLVSVSAASAAVADGLSTACCLLDRDQARSAVAAFAGAEIELII